MQSGTAIIIHPSLIVQQGLKNILLSRNLGIGSTLNSVPETAVLNNWKNSLLLVDILFTESVKKYRKLLKKNGNTIVGLNTGYNESSPGSAFDEVIDINDSPEVIFQKIGGYLSELQSSRTGNQLSVREIEILTLIAQGYSNKLIADQLFISIHTVITHRKNITAKLGIKSISGLTLYAALNNMVESHS